MKTIPLTQGYVALIDDADFETVSDFNWYAIKKGKYAARNVQNPNGTRTVLLMHKFLMPGVPEIDHEDGDGLNNQRKNLRPATHRQNLQGFQKKRAGASSIFRGVTWDKQYQNWKTQVQVDGKNTYVGRFSDEDEAARAYDDAASRFFGRFASLNFPPQPLE